ncbi:hypothetical protein EQZ23_00600 [Sphingomonas sp. UV9]|uniref:hypothetical protein n=1 Tax=Sphingomonas sp. UV9 TaxID=1851410 RepID=UPI000FFBD740|nr:hypothetical protein [Sphingomonas sp. UV9]RXD06660.1 hypothetical protein EQZ23_00600 [Sphingomonas sp. UV9]
MHEPSPRTSRLVVAGSAAAFILLGGGGFLLGRSTAPTPPPPAITPAAVPVAAPVAVPEAPVARVLSRADIIEIANAAADATSSGAKMPKRVAAAEGAQFEVDLPFGCDGPAAETSREPFRWRYDGESSSLRISVAPAVFDPGEWLGKPLSGSAGTTSPAASEEAIEGFWIARPWSSRGTCEAGSPTTVPLGIDAVTLPGQTLGLAQIFTDQDSKNARRSGKPYESVRRIGENDLKIDQGLRVRLRGRVARFPDGSTVRCRQPAGKEQRPICLVAVSFDDVGIENPSTQDTIATWASASRT